MRAALLACALLVASVDAHGFITTPTSRNSVVCDKLWPDYLKHYNNNNFWCKTDRESHCPPIPGEAKDCQGSSTGQFPGKGVPLEPFCSAGHDSRITSAVKGLSTPGPVQATYTAGQEVQLSWQVAANHGGKYQWRICRDGSDSDSCFKREPISGWIQIDDGAPVGHKFSSTVKMPEEPCERCTLSMRWDGLHESVIFASCADIRITGRSPGPHPGPAPPGPKPGPSPPAPKPTPHPAPPPTPKPLPPGTKSCPKCGGGACGCSWVKPGMCNGKTSANCGSCCACCCCGLSSQAAEANATAVLALE